MDFKVIVFRREDGYVGMGASKLPEGAELLASIESDGEHVAWRAARTIWNEEARKSEHPVNVEMREDGVYDR